MEDFFELKMLKDKVLHILKQSGSSRNSDKSLFIGVVRTFYKRYLNNYNELHLTSLYQLPSFESIRRVRQSIQSKGEYLPTDPKILKQRHKRAEEMKTELFDL